MALVVDSDPFSQTCNSYASLAEMASYVVDHDASASELVAGAWDALEINQRSAYLVDATRRLDGLMDWIGEKNTLEQNLKWPRVNAVIEDFYLDPTIFPQPVVDATCEMAIWLMQNDGVVAVTQSQAYSAIRVGPINIDFNDRLQTAPQTYAPDIIAILLKDYGQMVNPDLPGTKQIRIARLIRA